MAIEDVTERKQAAEIQYRRLFEAAKDAIFIIDDSTGAITDVNPYTTEMTGYSRERLVGKRIRDIEPFREMDNDELISELRSTATARRDGASMRLRNGRLVSVDIIASSYMVGSQRVIQMNMRDVSDRRSAEAALRQSEERFRLFVDSVRDYALFQMDTSGTIVSWNLGAERVLGYREQEIIGRSSALLFTPEDVEREQPRKELETALRDGRAEDERWHIRKDGSRFWGSGVVTLVRDESGRLRGFAKIMRDHTERKRAEEQLQAALREKEQLLREIHHRVKNNLQVITSLLNIQAASATGPTLASLEQMRDRVRAIARIHELLYKSRSVSGINVAEHTQALASELLEVYGVEFYRVRVKLEMESIILNLERAVPCGLILNELVSNALKHAFPDGRRGEITVTMRRDNGNYRLSVADNGVGMAEAVDLPHTKTLGLRLVSIFVEQLQGTFNVERGEGTRFEIVFPVAVS
jgi:PAS domain S-box-containing protein